MKKSDEKTLSRRSSLKYVLSLPAVFTVSQIWSVAQSGAAHAKAGEALEDMSTPTPSKTDCRTLIVYFTRSGNTRVIAEQLQRDLNADIFQIEPSTPYPADYSKNVEEARREKESQAQRSLKNKVANISNYEKIFIGFPIWGGTAPAIIRTFLSEHDLAGKILVPFITHGKYGMGDSLSVVSKHAPRAKLIKGFSQECDQERDTMEQVDVWLKKLDSQEHVQQCND